MPRNGQEAKGRFSPAFRTRLQWTSSYFNRTPAMGKKAPTLFLTDRLRRFTRGDPSHGHCFNEVNLKCNLNHRYARKSGHWICTRMPTYLNPRRLGRTETEEKQYKRNIHTHGHQLIHRTTDMCVYVYIYIYIYCIYTHTHTTYPVRQGLHTCLLCGWGGLIPGIERLCPPPQKRNGGHVTRTATA
jgi:hypothetical protein